MSNLKMTILSLWRKRYRTLLVLLIMTLIAVLFCTTWMIAYACASSQEQLRDQLMTTFSIKRDPYNADLYDITAFAQQNPTAYYTGPALTQELYDAILDTEGVTGGNWEQLFTSVEVQGCASVPGLYTNAVDNGDYTGTQAIGVYGPVKTLLSSFSLSAFAETNTALCSYFTSGQMYLAQGRHIVPEDENVLLVSAEFAQCNGLQVGDVVSVGKSVMIQEMGFDPEIYEDRTYLLEDRQQMYDREFAYAQEVEIIGIFDFSVEPITDATTTEYMMPQNLLLMDRTSSLKLYERYVEDAEAENPEKDYYEELIANNHQQMDFSVENASMLDAVLARIQQQMPETADFAWITNEASLNASIAPLLWMQKLMRTMTLCVLGVGAVLLVLVLLFWSKGRQKETVAALGVGLRRKDILIQMLAEGCILAILASAIAFLPAQYLGQRVQETLMTQAVEQTDQEALAQMPSETAVNVYNRELFSRYRVFTAENMEVHMTAATAGITVAMMLVLSIVAMLLANLRSLRLKPREMLNAKQ